MYRLMAETFMINHLMIKSKSKTRLERLQQDKEMITQQVFVRLSVLQRSLPTNCSLS